VLLRWNSYTFNLTIFISYRQIKVREEKSALHNLNQHINDAFQQQDSQVTETAGSDGISASTEERNEKQSVDNILYGSTHYVNM